MSSQTGNGDYRGSGSSVNSPGSDAMVTADSGENYDSEDADYPQNGAAAADPRGALYAKNRRHPTEGWWSIGTTGRSNGIPLTHQSARLTMTGHRVFSSSQRDDVWDLTDSLLELYDNEHRLESALALEMGVRGLRALDHHQDARSSGVADWLAADAGNGYLRVYAPDMTNFANSQLIPCTLGTPVHKVCAHLGISSNSLHVQMNGDVVRRLDPLDLPLVVQNDYLVALGYTSVVRIQEEGSKEDLAYLIKFYSGKPIYDSTFSRSQLKAILNIKKGGLLQQWTQRLCVVSGTRLLVYKDQFSQDEPAIIQLARGSIEEIKLKGHDLCLKLTSTVQGDRLIYLSFTNEDEYGKWLRKCKKATDKLPTAADLSSCHLEYLPENIFINDQLAMLNLQHNVLKQRPLDDDIYTIGWIEDLNRFTCLRSLNLADNRLEVFPPSLCYINTLVELNLASNKLTEIPIEIQLLTNLQALHVHNNHLTSLPDQLIQLRKLFVLVLAFNRFASLPPVVAQMTNVRFSEVENIIMAGNQIEKISSETLMEMKYVKKLDLRLNQLLLPTTETMKFTILEHLTHLDIRDNRVTDLDIRAVKTLEYLNCERNAMSSLQLNGTSLKLLFVAYNCLERLVVSPKPEWLLQIDVMDNCLETLPDWLSDCFFLQKINASKNFLRELPPRIFVDPKKLKSLRVGNNQLTSLPTDVDNLFLEELHVQGNFISHLPNDFLQKANKLRVLNATKNRLSSLPPLNANQDLNKVQELYLSGNLLGDDAMRVISGYSRLKILHLAQNEITVLHDSEIQMLELLQEFNISTNQLQCLPKALGNLPKLIILRAHSNFLNTLPDFHRAKSLRVLDVGHNQLFNVSVTNLMASQLNLLDMSLNSQLKVDPKEFKTIKNKKSVCLVDLSGQNRRLPGFPQKNNPTNAEDGPASDNAIPWKVGFSETSGVRNKLCIAMIKLLKFRTDDESLFGMFDGGRNNEVSKILVEMMGDIVREEIGHHQTSKNYMKYALLAAHRKLKLSGQRLGSTAVLCHIQRHSASNQMNHFTLNVANVGDTEAVLCRRGEAVLLTRKFVTTVDREECLRIYKSDGMITEDSKVNGTTQNTRMLGCAYLSPLVVPDPFSTTVALRNDDEFIVIANGAFWEHVGYDEAVEEIYEMGNPILAGKHLQDLAQGYGARENVAILVIRLNTDHGPSLGRLRPVRREMSIDDVEAAMQHDELKAKRAAGVAAVVARRPSKLRRMPSDRLAHVSDLPIYIRSPLPAAQPAATTTKMAAPSVVAAETSRAVPVGDSNGSEMMSSSVADSLTVHRDESSVRSVDEDFVRTTVSIDKPSTAGRKKTTPPGSASVPAMIQSSGSGGKTTTTTPVLQSQPPPATRQRFVKKGISTDWDSMMIQRRTASTEAADDASSFLASPPPHPLYPSKPSSNRNSVVLASKTFSSIQPAIVLPRYETPDDVLFASSSFSAFTDDGFSANPAYSYIPDVKDRDLIHMMAKTSQTRLPYSSGSLGNAVARYERSTKVERTQTRPPDGAEDLSGSRRSSAATASSMPPQKSNSAQGTYRKISAEDDFVISNVVGHLSSFEPRNRSYSAGACIAAAASASASAASASAASASASATSASASAASSSESGKNVTKFQNLSGSVEANLYHRVSKVGAHPLGGPENRSGSGYAAEFEEMEILEDGEMKVIEIARL